MTWWNFPKKAWLIILAELVMIGSLFGLLYSTYLNDIYFRAYTDSLSPVLVPTLSVAFGISSASIATYLYLGMKRVRTLQHPEIPVRKRSQPRRTTKRPLQPSALPPDAPNPPPTMTTKLKPIVPSQRHGQLQKSPSKEREDHSSIHENTKEI